MNPIIECVANVSEGRDAGIVQALENALQSVREVALLDRHVDPDHHRSVFTFAGNPEAVTEAAFHLIQRAVPLIDLNHHEGNHPRVGAVDVVPFVPLQDATVPDCIQQANRLGERVGAELHVPVFLYERACPVATRRPLEEVRRGGLEALGLRMTTDLAWLPDFGPSTLHPTAGAVVVGARRILIAYNVVLQSDDLSVAQSISKTIRTSAGGLPSLKAIGIKLHSRNLVQVSMNLIDYHQTSVQDAFLAIEQEANTLGVGIVESELVGLVPGDALPPHPISSLKIRTWSPDQVLETRLAQVGLAS